MASVIAFLHLSQSKGEPDPKASSPSCHVSIPDPTWRKHAWEQHQRASAAYSWDSGWKPVGKPAEPGHRGVHKTLSGDGPVWAASLAEVPQRPAGVQEGPEEMSLPWVPVPTKPINLLAANPGAVGVNRTDEDCPAMAYVPSPSHSSRHTACRAHSHPTRRNHRPCPACQVSADVCSSTSPQSRECKEHRGHTRGACLVYQRSCFSGLHQAGGEIEGEGQAKPCSSKEPETPVSGVPLVQPGSAIAECQRPGETAHTASDEEIDSAVSTIRALADGAGDANSWGWGSPLADEVAIEADLLHNLETLGHTSAASESSAGRVLAAGALGPLVRLMLHHDALVVEHATSALLAIASHHALLDSLSKERGCTAKLLQLLHLDPVPAAPQLAAAPTGSKSGAPSTTAGATSGSPNAAAARANAAAVLGCLCALEGPTREVLDSDAVPLLVEMVKHGGAQEKKDASRCLASLARAEEAWDSIAESGAVRVLCRLKQHEGIHFLDLDISALFAALCKTPKGRRALLFQGAIPVLAELVDADPDDCVRENSLSALVDLVSHDGSASKEAVLATGISVTLDSMNKHGVTSPQAKAACLLRLLYE